ncbi:hypothetical protein [Sphingobacterium sp. LRF_L2]|uniref:hypothetical protein n=1 Tax=Sphingobacterium sp. LRF_L2 TaxID=3369421 RepID=UPI003F63DECE
MDKNYENLNWSQWEQLPSPENCRQIDGPKGPGVYQIRNSKTRQLILFGIGIKCRNRMKSIFPKPYGTGTRNNEDKRNFVLENWWDLEYRTLETDTRDEAYGVENIIKSFRDHLFNT